MRERCLPSGVGLGDLQRVEKMVYARRRVKRGESLFISGDPFNAVYAIRSGFFKTSLIADHGREQVTGFFMGGELIIGVDSTGAGRYNGTATALEDSDICVIPFALVEEVSREVPALQRQLHAVLAREIMRDHGVLMLLGSMRAEGRLATFLIDLSERFVRRGYASSDFHLRMTRHDIGSYLGLELETVSRVFSQFQKDGLIEVKHRHVRILDIGALALIARAVP